MKKKIIITIIAIITLFLGSVGTVVAVDHANAYKKEPQYKIYEMAQKEGYEGSYDNWLSSIKGADGEDGRSIELDLVDGKIVWRYVGNTEYRPIYSVNDLIGPKGEKGEPGKDGLSVLSISKTESHELNGCIIDTYTIVYSDGSTSNFIITNGKNGESGSNGLDGKDGIQGVPGKDGYISIVEISNDGYWVIDGVKTQLKAESSKGEPGDNGQDGTNGINGKTAYEIYLEYFPDYKKSEKEWLDDLINGNLVEEVIVNHTVTFNTGCDATIDSQIVPDFRKINEPELLTKEGYSFEGWYVGDEKWNFDRYYVTEDTNLTAKWSILTFNVDIIYPKEFNKDVHKVYNYGEVVSLDNISYPGYEFVKYVDQNGQTLLDSFVIKEDKTITAVYDKLHSISFNSNGGSYISPIYVKNNQIVDSLPNPTYGKDKIFEYWEYNGLKVNLPFEFTKGENIVLKAHYSKNYHVQIKYDSDVEQDVDIYVKENEKIYLNENVVRNGFGLEYFLDINSGNHVTSPIIVRENLNISAIYRSKYVVSFIGELSDSSRKEYYLPNETINLPVLNKHDYEFLGWFYNDKKVENGSPYLYGKDITVESRFKIKEKYTITFTGDYENQIDPLICYGGGYYKLPNAQKTGYEFLGWFYNDKKVENGSPYLYGKDITLEARFAKIIANNNFEYLSAIDQIYIKKYIGTDSKVVVPDMLDGLPVTKINNNAFAGNTNITSVNLPNSITTIDDYAFSKCNNLMKINFPSSLQKIGNSAFENCKLSNTDLFISKDLVNINYNAFIGTSFNSISVDPLNTIYDSRSNCNALILTADNRFLLGTNISTIPEGIQYIEPLAFSNCDLLTEIILPESLLNIKYKICDNCPNLKNVFISKNVKNVEGIPFANCSGIEKIVVDPANPYIDSRENCNAIIITATNYMRFGCKNTKIPNTVTGIARRAFEGTIADYIVVPATVAVKYVALAPFKNIFLEVETIPTDFGNYDPNTTNVYVKGEWEYDALGSPKPINKI